MNNFNFDEQNEPIYDYYENKKKNSVFYLILLALLIFIIVMFQAKKSDNRISQIIAEDITNFEESNLYEFLTQDSKYDKDVLEFNKKFSMYFCDTIRGKDVKKLLSVVDTNNNTEDTYKVRILFHVSETSTTSGTLFYELSGTTTSMDTYINEILDQYYYFVNVHETNADGSIYSIVISDNVYKYLYE